MFVVYKEHTSKYELVGRTISSWSDIQFEYWMAIRYMHAQSIVAVIVENSNAIIVDILSSHCLC